ncbi:MAG: GYD domain-containing protein [Desulfobacteria bacterium]|nr:MAG: GYD domain superfamily [Desulfobacterales bacterium C00003106]OEU59542.1 MAG: GYD domain superfamily [Desulfobacterales bacterium C00003104]
MAHYVMLSTLTDEGRKTLKKNPERLQEVNKEVEAMGAKILVQYAMLGEYDFVTIMEAPDNMTIARISVELGSRGTMHAVTMAAISVDEFIGSLK